MSAAAGDTSPHWLRWAFWIVLAGFLFLHPTRPAFWGSHNESRRAQISAEMLRPDASFFVPTLNGEPILTKPPLGYWLQAMSLRLFGINEGSARLPGMLAALFVVILVFRAGSRWQGRDVGTVSAAVLTSSLLFMEWCRYAELDIIFAALIATSMVCLMRAVTEPDKRRTAIFQFWVAAGLGFMVKGPFAFIFPLAGLLCYCAWQRDWALLRATFLNLGVVAALLICLPYYLYLLTQVDGAKAVLLGETVSRFDGQSVHRAGLLYYVKYLPLFGPWLLLLIPAIWTRVKARDREPVGMFLVAFLVGSFVVASLVSSKKPQYLLPLAPAAALLVGEWVSGSSLTYSRRVIALSASCVALVALWAARWSLLLWRRWQCSFC
jgi:4-amino-4-deoxy-L-arabinose transferase-like glycosyltransferase